MARTTGAASDMRCRERSKAKGVASCPTSEVTSVAPHPGVRGHVPDASRPCPTQGLRPHLLSTRRRAVPPRPARPFERRFRPQGGDTVSGAPAARGARVRAKPVAGGRERRAEEVLPAHGPGADRAERGAGNLGRDDPRRGAGAGRGPMTPSEEYLGRVRRGMAGMEPGVRDDILRELRSHIAESTAASGGNVGSSLTALGSPEEAGRRYRDLYGYGRAFKGLFTAI